MANVAAAAGGANDIDMQYRIKQFSQVQDLQKRGPRFSSIKKKIAELGAASKSPDTEK